MAFLSGCPILVSFGPWGREGSFHLLATLERMLNVQGREAAHQFPWLDCLAYGPSVAVSTVEGSRVQQLPLHSHVPLLTLDCLLVLHPLELPFVLPYSDDRE
jgi:hypothetical protein